MIIYRRTSLLESPAQTLVNTVNCVGVMGKGLAHEFRQREPQMFERYRDICERRLLSPGKLWLWRGSDSWVLNFPTKIHWRNPSKIEWIEEGLAKFLATYEEVGIKEASFPRLGCGNGNLDWDDVRPLMERYLSRARIPIFIHDYQKDIGVPEHLDEVARTVAQEVGDGLDFTHFLAGIRVASDVGAGELRDLESQQPFTAELSGGDSLRIDTGEHRWDYDSDELHGAWVSMLRGLATKDRVEWASGGGGQFVLTLMSLLPNSRPVEIQRGPMPELAVELKPSARITGLAGEVREQLRLECH